ncbi:class 1 fructose-1,6-bisphosphatase [Pycnococcus provasolii]
MSVMAEQNLINTSSLTNDSANDKAQCTKGKTTLAAWLLRQGTCIENSSEMMDSLAPVVGALASACTQTSYVVRSGNDDILPNSLAPAPAARDALGVNASGERQKKLDIVSNALFELALRKCGRCAMYVSEEVEDPVAFEAASEKGHSYVVALDPLDGSSNIEFGGIVGTIFGIWKYPAGTPTTADGAVSICRGDQLVAAGYCMYSSCTQLVLTVGTGVYGFVLDPSTDEFRLSHVDVKIPDSGKIYSFNEGNYAMWEEGLQSYITSLKTGGAKQGTSPYSARYIGCLVGDFHRTLLYGGIYGYPSDSKNRSGKLRLLYECAPMSMIIEQAGGAGTTGASRVLDVVPTETHERVPFFVGSKDEIAYLETFLNPNATPMLRP